MYGRSYGQIVAMASALLAMAALLVELPTGAVRTIGALALVLVLPGYSLSRLLVPELHSRGRMSFALAVGLSMAATVLGGLLLNLTPWGITAEGLAAWLSSLTLVAGGLALARTRSEPQAGEVGGGGQTAPRDVALFTLAIAVAVAAIAAARTGAVQQSEANTTQLWLLRSEQASSDSLELGVRSLEVAPTSYRLQVRSGDQLLGEWSSIPLAPGEEWRGVLTLPSGDSHPETVEARLYVAGSDTVFRFAVLRQAGESADPAASTAGMGRVEGLPAARPASRERYVQSLACCGPGCQSSTTRRVDTRRPKV